MGRIKELQEKGNLDEVEQKELDELLAEAKSADSDNTEEKDLDEAAKKFTDKVVSGAEEKLSKSIEKLTEALATSNAPRAKVTKQPAYIVDKKFGKKTIDELGDIKETVEKRVKDGKKNTEISRKTLNFLQAVVEGDVQKLQILVEGTGARGGFLVPEDFANMIVEDLRDATVMRNIADVLTTTSDTFHLPSLSRRPQASFRAEAAVKQTSTVDFGETVFTPYSLASIVALSNELVADASMGVGSSIVNYVSEVMARSLAEREDRAFFTGSGSTQPTGMSTYTLGTLSGGITDASRADAIKQTWARLGQLYRNRSVWVMNALTLERVITYKDSQGNYLTSRIGDQQQMTLMGRPIYEQNDIAAGTVYFGDFSYYKIVDREGLEVRVSDEATVASQSAFEQNLTYVRVEKRVDGELVNLGSIRSATSMGNP